MKNLTIIDVKINDLDRFEQLFSNLDQSSQAFLSAFPKDALTRNPFCRPDDSIQLIALDGDKAVGRLLVFPLELYADGQIYRGWSGSDLFVHPDYRKHGVGSQLIRHLFKNCHDGFFIAHGISAQAKSLYHSLNTKMRDIPIYKMILCSQNKLRFKLGPFAQLISPLVNAYLRLKRKRSMKALLPKAALLKQYKQIPDAMKGLKLDAYRFAENHSPQYLEWLASYSLRSEETAPEKHFYGIESNGELIGFYMIYRHRMSVDIGAKRYHYTQSLVAEWESFNTDLLPEEKLCYYAMLSEGEKAASVAIHTMHEPTIRLISQDYTVVADAPYTWGFFVGENSPLRSIDAIYDVDKWRIRTITGDVGLI